MNLLVEQGRRESLSEDTRVEGPSFRSPKVWWLTFVLAQGWNVQHFRIHRDLLEKRQKKGWISSVDIEDERLRRNWKGYGDSPCEILFRKGIVSLRGLFHQTLIQIDWMTVNSTPSKKR